MENMRNMWDDLIEIDREYQEEEDWEEIERRVAEEQWEKEAEEREAERMERENPLIEPQEFIRKFRYRNGKPLRHVHIEYIRCFLAYDFVNKKEFEIWKTVHEIDTDDIEFAAAAAEAPEIDKNFSSCAYLNEHLEETDGCGNYSTRCTGWMDMGDFQVSPAYIQSLPKETNGYGKLWEKPLDERIKHPSALDFENELSQI